MINDSLKELGLTDKEVTVYLAVLRNGKIIPADLAKLTGINRTTVYSVAEELVRKGFLYEDLAGAIKYFVPIAPDDLDSIIRREEKKLEKKKELVAKAVKELKIFSQGTKYIFPKIRFVWEDELKSFFVKQTDKWEKSARETEPCWYGFQDESFVDNYAEYINWYWLRPNNEMKLKLFSSKCESEVKIKQRNYFGREVKFFSKKMPFTASTMVIGKYIIMVVSKQNPHYAIEIKNAELANNLREVFKLLWISH